MAILSEKEQEGMRQLAKDSLYFLAKAVLGFEQVSLGFHWDVCEFLEGKHRFKLVCLPRGFFKTTLATKTNAVRNSLIDPWCSQLICCQIVTNAKTILDDIRQLWEHRTMLQLLFPELMPDTARNWNSEQAMIGRPQDGFHQQEATYESSGIGTQLQSRHYDHLFADDLVVARKDQVTGAWMQPSEEDIQKAIGWHQMTWGIMRDAAKTNYTQIMTRWSTTDLYDYLLTNEPSAIWPKIAPRTGWSVLLRSAEDAWGRPTFPEKYPKIVLDQIAASQGQYKYSTQYLSVPVASERLLFRDKYSIYVDAPAEALQTIVAACDPAIGQAKTASKTAIVVVGAKETGERFVLDVLNERLRPAEIVEKTIALWRKWKFKRLGLEVVAYQEALKDAFQDKFVQEGGPLFRIVPFRPGAQEPKAIRIQGLEPSFAAGWWAIRNNMTALREQLDEYPYTGLVDILDALANANKMLPSPRGNKDIHRSEQEQLNDAMVTYESIMKALEKPSGSRADMFPSQFSEPERSLPVAGGTKDASWV